MSQEKAKSAIDAVYEILEKLETLEKQIKVIDSNIKLLNNKVSKLTRVPETPKAMVPGLPSAAVPSPEGAQNVKVFGRIKNKTGKPIKGVEVKFFTKQGEILKSRVTDGDGYWEARVPPGTYGVEYDPSRISSKLKTANIKVVIPDGITEFDISKVG